jgi:hypothetical protein
MERQFEQTGERKMALHPSTFEYLMPTDEQVEMMSKVRAAAKVYRHTRCPLARRTRQDVHSASASFECDVGERRHHPSAGWSAEKVSGV